MDQKREHVLSVTPQRSGGTFVLAPGVDALPFEVRQPADWELGVPGLSLCAVLILMGLGCIWSEDWPIGAAGLAFLACGGVGAAFFVDTLLRSTLWHFDGQTVQYRTDGPLRHSFWLTPMNDYSGVLLEACEGWSRRGLSHVSIPRYRVLLRYRYGRSRDVCFYAGFDLTVAREVESKMASLFSETVVTPSQRNQDESGRMLAAGHPPGPLSVRRDDGSLRIGYRPSRSGALREVSKSNLGLPALILTVVLEVLSVLMLSFRAFLQITICVAVVVATAAVLLYTLRRLSRDELRLEAGRLSVRRLWPWGSGHRTVLRAEAIRHVAVQSEGPHGRALQIVAAERSLWWGIGLPVEALEWVRDCIIAVIGRGPAASAATTAGSSGDAS
jgi:hypothetical protein